MISSEINIEPSWRVLSVEPVTVIIVLFFNCDKRDVWNLQFDLDLMQVYTTADDL